MATLQKIRNRAGLLVAIIIGLALFAFILGDMLKSGSSLMKPSQLEVAEINGETVQYPDFQKKIEELSEVYKMNYQTNQLDENAWTQVREQAWQSVLRDLVMTDVYDELGVAVSSDELFELVQGANPHRIVQQLFRNPNTGVFDKDFALTFLKNLQTSASPQHKMYWLYVENEIKTEQLQSKYNNMVGKGLFVTTKEAEMSLAEKNKKVNFQYIPLQYSAVADSSVVVSDKDLKAYYAEHKEDYKQTTSRKIEYVSFPVEASAADDAATKKWIEDIKADFEKAQDNAQFVNVNSDVRFDESYSKKEELNGELADFAFSGSVGDVYGPYKELDSYKLAKIDDYKMLPDSVKASHILITPQSAGTPEIAQQLADSLTNLLKNGANFAKLATEYSQDPGSAAKGGDLGWFGRNMMVKPFEQTAFEGEINEINQAVTQFGIHIIKTTKKGKTSKQVRLAVLERKVSPSTQTYQDVYTQASKFASENQDYESYKQAIIDQKLSKKSATLKEDTREVAGLKYSRTLVRAAFEAEINDILENNEGSTIFEFEDQFIIAALVNIAEEGYSPFEEVKARIELAVRKDKKADMLIGKAKAAITENADLEAIAGKLDSEVKDATNISFTTYSIPEMGMEPAVMGTVTALAKDKVSEPVKGNNGVYVVKVLSINEGEITNVPAEKETLAQAIQNRISFATFNAHKEAVEIVDKRAKFY